MLDLAETLGGPLDLLGATSVVVGVTLVLPEIHVKDSGKETGGRGREGEDVSRGERLRNHVERGDTLGGWTLTSSSPLLPLT